MKLNDRELQIVSYLLARNSPRQPTDQTLFDMMRKAL